MLSFSAGSCTAFLVSHLIRWLLNRTSKNSRQELLSAAACLAGLLIALLPDHHGFGSCIGLHMCVYGFMLTRAFRSIPKIGLFPLAQVLWSVTWPLASVCIIGSRCLQHGVVQIAVAIVLIMTAAGQENMLTAEELSNAIKQLRPVIVALTLTLMAILTTLMSTSHQMLLLVVLPVQVAEAQFEGCATHALNSRIYLVLAAGISTITLGGLALVVSENTEAHVSACTSDPVPATTNVDRGTCRGCRVSEATQDRPGRDSPARPVQFSAMNLLCKPCSSPTLSARSVPAETMARLQNPVQSQPSYKCRPRSARAKQPLRLKSMGALKRSITSFTSQASTPDSLQTTAPTAGCSNWVQTARPIGFQPGTVRSPDLSCPLPHTSCPPRYGNDALRQLPADSYGQLPASPSPLRTSNPQSVADPAIFPSHSGNFSKALLQRSIHCSSARGCKRGAQAAQAAVLAQERPGVEPAMQELEVSYRSAGLHLSPLADTSSRIPLTSALDTPGTQTERLHERLRGAASEGHDHEGPDFETPETTQRQPWVHPQLQGLLLTLRQSASTLAHDMRNPLTLVLAMSDLLRKKDDTPTDVQQQCLIIHTCAHHMLMMISAMRDNLWLMTGRLDLVPSQAQVLPLVQDALESLQGLVRQRVHVQVDVAADLLCCMDLDRLKHIIHIPLANAVKYTKRGTVKISAREEGDFVLLKFSNSGVAPNLQTLEAFSLEAGVPAASDPHSRMRCGLRFVTQILRESGGSVSLKRNGEGHSGGCTVTLMLPRIASTRASEPMLILSDGTSSLQDLTPDQANAALETSMSVALQEPPVSSGDGLAADPQPDTSAGRSHGVGDIALPSGGPQPQFHSEAFPHGPVDPALAKDIEKMIDITSKDASGPTSAEERTEHLKRYFEQVDAVQVQGSSQAPLRDALKLVQEHGIPLDNPSDHTILIVDDDETNVHVLESLLSREGYRTMSALSGFQALELFSQAMPKPSCVLLDIGLPDISGEEVCSKLLQMSAHMPVPIIIVSQRKETKDVIGGLRRGAVDYIRKPFESEEVLARLGTILRFHMMDLQQRRASTKQVLEMMRLVFPQHIVDLATTGHRVVAENISCAVVLSLHVHGFRTMSSSVPMVSAVSKVSSLLSMISTEILSRGIEQVDMAQDKYIACAIAEDSSEIPEKVVALVKAAEVIFRKCEAMQAGNTLRLQICGGLHAGPAVATVVGIQRPKWVMFGEAPGIAESLRKAAAPSSILLSSDVAKVLQAHNPPHKCLLCTPVMLKGYGMIRPYTLPVGAYQAVMQGQYHDGTNPDKGKRMHTHRSDHGLDKAPCASTRPQTAPMPQVLAAGSDKAGSADMHDSSMSLDQWLTQLGLGHYRPVLTGLTVSQVRSMDTRMLQEAGVITGSAVRRIQRAIGSTRSLSK